MADLHLRPTGDHGLIHNVTPQSAGWGHVGFALHRLRAGESLSDHLPDREVCLVPVTGTMTVSTGDQVWTAGGRKTPFDLLDGHKAGCVYVPAGQAFTVTAQDELELAICSAPGTGGVHPARLIGPDDIAESTRGQGTNTRHVFDILPETQPAESLLVVEVITPSGNWSSYPSHKHDTDNLPHESYLEETYYHRFDRLQGWGFQRVYTDDRTLDESMPIGDGDVVLVPKGYHPCAAAHGYNLYYLNVMAGPVRTWKVNNEVAHEWLLG